MLLNNDLKEVNSEYLMDYTYEISKYERNSGSNAELKAFKYIEEKLQSFGIRTCLTFNEAYISLPIESRLSIDGEAFSSITASMSGPTSKEGVELELIYVDDIARLDDTSFDASNKALVIDGFAVRGYVQKAIEKGAKACIFINGEHLHNMIVSPVWGNPTLDTIHQIPRIHVVNIDHVSGAKVIQAAKQNKIAHIVTRVDEGWRKIPTLIADIKGEVEPDKYILFSGHVDSWHYGAMDNATANATMIEVARILVQEPLRRSLKIAFWSGHSHGRYAGSAHYYDENFLDIHENCLLHVNVDSVGAKGASVVTEGNIMSLTKRLAVDVIKQETGELFKGKPFGRSGDQSFWGAGVPSAFMGFSGQPMSADLEKIEVKNIINQFNNGPESSGFGWWWHTSEDTFDKIDEGNLERDARVFLVYVSRACNDAVLPLDVNTGVQELCQKLMDYIEIISLHIPTDKLEASIQSFMGVNKRLNELLSENSFESHNQINQLIQVLARVVVRLMQVNVSKFDHDPAMPFPSVPMLSAVHKLKDHRDECEYYMLITEVRRRLNQVNFILFESVKEANRLLKD